MKIYKEDLLASVVVFLVALPLCLGIALASGAPLLSGVIAGIVGGIVVSLLSGSALGVSGPAAGLAVIVLLSIQELQSFELFLFAVVVSGLIQVCFGFFKAGVIQHYFPSAVIKGMLTGIGVVIILKQFPHMLGYNLKSQAGVATFQGDAQGLMSQAFALLQYLNFGAVTISMTSLFIMLFWEKLGEKANFAKIFPGSLLAVFAGILLCLYDSKTGVFGMRSEQFVNLGAISSIDHFLAELRFPDFSQWNQMNLYVIALTIAVVGSLETLLCLEATDKLDPEKRVTPPNKELIAQGVGNMVSGFIGGLPITQVIVRSSANIHSGGKSKVSALCHGFLLLFSVVFFANLLNLIPLASLATILLLVGYKLAKPELFHSMYRAGWQQFLPFMGTVLGILFTDLLVGIGIGLAISILHIVWNSYRNPYQFEIQNYPNDKTVKITLAEYVSFLHKARLVEALRVAPRDGRILIDASSSKFIHPDVEEVIEKHRVQAKAEERVFEVRYASSQPQPQPMTGTTAWAEKVPSS